MTKRDWQRRSPEQFAKQQEFLAALINCPAPAGLGFRAAAECYMLALAAAACGDDEAARHELMDALVPLVRPALDKTARRHGEGRARRVDEA
jgi:hypothetical protein